MQLIMNTRQLTLEREQSLAVHDGRGMRILCTGGTLWLTQDKDLRDIVLEAGEAFVLERNGVTMINALSSACLKLEPSGAPAAPALKRVAQAIGACGGRLIRAILGAPVAHWRRQAYY